MNAKIIKLPQNFEAEKALLSIILLDQDKLIEVIDLLEVKDFYNITSQLIWSAINTLYKRSEEIDSVSLITEIKKQSEADSQMVLREVASYYDSPISSSNIKKFAQEIKNCSLLRQLLLVLEDKSNQTLEQGAEAEKILGELEKDVVMINEKTTDKRKSEVTDVLQEVKSDIARAEQNGWQGIKTGFEFIDTRIGGLIPSQVWIIGAYTGVGKTFLSLQMMLNILKGGGKVVLFSTEMDRKMNVMRLLGNLAGLGTIKMMKGQLTEEEKASKAVAEKEIESYKNRLFIYDSVYTTEDIRLKAKKIKLNHGLDVIVVDFIQNLRGSENIYERMSKAAIDLQQIAQELNITMILVSQVSQASANWKESQEVIEYKGAGEIAAIADVGIWINKDKELKDIRHVHLRKVRHGSPGKFTVRVSFPSGRIIAGPVPGAMEVGDD